MKERKISTADYVKNADSAKKNGNDLWCKGKNNL